jgi:tetratricopeptide (TPR) repeat protein
MASRDVDKWLRQGVAAARSGQRERARALLTKVVEEDEENVTAWLWLSGVVDSLEERQICLENVLTIDPENEAAHKGLAVLRKQGPDPDELLREGVAAAKAGRREDARDLLAKVAEVDETNIVAWLWLSGVVDSLEERQICLENVLVLDPGNEVALRGLEAVRAERGVAAPGAEGPAFGAPEPDSAPTMPSSSDLNLEDEYACPYCGAPGEPEKTRCRSCRRSLAIRQRKQEKWSTWLWIGLGVQIFNVLWSFGLVIVFVFLVVGAVAIATADLATLEVDFINPGIVFRVLLGLTADVDPELTNTILTVIPGIRPLFYGTLFYTMVSVVCLVGLILRWQPVYWIFWFEAALGAVLAFAQFLIDLGNISVGIGGVVMALFLFGAAVQMRDDFVVKKKRILTNLDKGPVDGFDFLVRGQKYAREGMWAKAALHFEQASLNMADSLDALMALAAAYLKLERYDLARNVAEKAQQIDSSDPRIIELVAALAEG